MSVQGFQSLYRVDLDLGPFTVIVGPSSSGKSAFIRALRAVASNLRGTGWVSHGMPGLALTVRTASGAVVTLEKNLGANGYSVVAGGQSRVFTKTAGAVPSEVSQVLGVPPAVAGSTWFAGQFDGPYLVGDPGSQVAQVLGGLSGVGVIRQAAREGSRQSLAAAGKARAAQDSVERILNLAQNYADLPERRRVVADLQERLDAVERLDARVRDLESLIAGVREAQRALGELPPEVPRDLIVRASEVSKRFNAGVVLQGLVNQIVSDSSVLTDVVRERDQTEESARRAVEQYQKQLHDAGVCPTCGQVVQEEGVRVG